LEKSAEGDKVVITVDKDIGANVTPPFTIKPEGRTRPLGGSGNRLEFDDDPGYKVGQKIRITEVF
jgi:hypothetical protein